MRGMRTTSRLNNDTRENYKAFGRKRKTLRSISAEIIMNLQSIMKNYSSESSKIKKI